MLVLACDHGGYALKEKIALRLTRQGIPYKDLGCHDGEPVDYPLQAQKAAQAVLSGEAERALLFCGTGVGISIAANKFRGVRCAVCSEPYSARMSVEHNDCNMLALGGRVVGEELAAAIVDEWLNARFEGERHMRRVGQIGSIEEGFSL